MVRLGTVVAIGAGLLLAALLAVAARASLGTWGDLHPARVARPPAADPSLDGGRTLSLLTPDGVTLAAWWLPPRNGAAVVLVHGLHARRAQLAPQATALAGAGFGVLLLDLRAHGDSGGSRSTWGDLERLDVQAAVAFVRAQPGVRPGAVGAVGFSIGALAVAGAALRDPGIAAVALEGMQTSAEADIRRTYSSRGLASALPAAWTARAAGVRLDEVRPGEHLDRLRPRPVLLVYGGTDPAAPPDVGEALLRRLGPAGELWVVPGGRHGGWEDVAGTELRTRLVGFFRRALLDGARSSPALGEEAAESVTAPRDDGRAARARAPPGAPATGSGPAR